MANDFVSDEEFERLLHAWFGNLARVLLPGHCWYLWGGYANCANYPPVLKAVGLYYSQAIIWDKQHPVLTRKDYIGAHEWCFYGNCSRSDSTVVRLGRVAHWNLHQRCVCWLRVGCSLSCHLGWRQKTSPTPRGCCPPACLRPSRSVRLCNRDGGWTYLCLA